MTGRLKKIMWDQLFRLSSDRKLGLQRQLRGVVVSAILDDKIPLSTPLPSSRELARQLGIARNTVVLAYQQLIDEGYLLSRERSGYFVDPSMLTGRVGTSQHTGTQITHQPDLKRHLKCRITQQRNIVKSPDWERFPYPFIYGQSDPKLFPIADWRECCKQSLSVAGIQHAAPDHFDADDPQLVEQIQRRVLPRRGVWADKEEILITMGAQQALYLLSELLLTPDTRIGIEEPGYVDARNIFSLHTNRLIPLPVDQHGLILGPELEHCHYLYVTPSHQYPTTVTMPVERRKILLNKAVDNDMLLIEDDYESEINFEGNPSPALKSLDKNNRVIYIGSLSKTLSPGLRLGYMVGPAELIREARALRRLMIRHPPSNNQRAVALFLAIGHFDSLLHRLNLSYQSRWQAMGDALDRFLPDASSIPTFGGTAYWVKGPQELDARELQQQASAQGILIEPGDIYFMKEPAPTNFFRLGYSSIATEKITEGIRRLAELIHQSA
ncbi:MAG TPA: PLP-dependent aminotransferase family protein [Gammaproteobacteria bacterium]|nr:PLP-dependent aminotransferase family protein [Gammaproteobacteria bacterium]